MCNLTNFPRENNFDFLRFFAAALVIFSHSFPLTGINDREIMLRFSNGQWTLGGVAVSIFFIISGFLITHSYINSRSFSDYIIRRILRIFPGLIVVILISCFVLGPLVSSFGILDYFSLSQTYNYLGNIFMFPIVYVLPGVFENNIYPSAVNGSIWTLPYEFICYLLIPLLGLLGMFSRKKLLLWFTLLLALMYAMLPQSILGIVKNGIIAGSFIELLFCFLTGALFYFGYGKMRFNLFYFICTLFATLYLMRFGNFKIIIIPLLAYLVFCFAFSKWIKLNTFNKFGDLSYGLYIYAFPIQQCFQHYTSNSQNYFTHFLISFFITLIFAYLSWHLVEKHFIRNKARYYEKFIKLHNSN